MRRVLFAMLLLVVTPTVLLSPPTSAAVVSRPHKPLIHHRLVIAAASRALTAEALVRGVSLRALLSEWQRVAICEVNGNWSMTGPVYSGIGFSNATWYEYGGRSFAPLAGDATRDQQILVGMRVTGGWVPDQDGCNPGGW
ncbi:MAG: transglycosylase family protein [Acidimicrobiales bacterium]